MSIIRIDGSKVLELQFSDEERGQNEVKERGVMRALLVCSCVAGIGSHRVQ
jgi:hypothetical protein